MTLEEVRMAAQMECIALDIAELNAALSMVHGMLLCLGRPRECQDTPGEGEKLTKAGA